MAYSEGHGRGPSTVICFYHGCSDPLATFASFHGTHVLDAMLPSQNLQMSFVSLALFAPVSIARAGSTHIVLVAIVWSTNP